MLLSKIWLLFVGRRLIRDEVELIKSRWEDPFSFFVFSSSSFSSQSVALLLRLTWTRNSFKCTTTSKVEGSKNSFRLLHNLVADCAPPKQPNSRQTHTEFSIFSKSTTELRHFGWVQLTIKYLSSSNATEQCRHDIFSVLSILFTLCCYLHASA